LYESFDEKNQEVSKSISDLKYMDIIFVYLIIDKDKISDDHWLYFSDKNIIFNRAVEFKNWSKKMSPENQTSLCLDITCYRSDKSVNNPWNYSKKDLTERCIDDCVKIGLLEKKDISDTLVVKVKDAYPFYDLHYKKRLEFIISFLEKSKDIFCIGRTGLFSYNNSDGSIEMGINLEKNLSIDQKDSFLDYKFRKNSF
jgi:UDP-galactopyranose mutase